MAAWVNGRFSMLSMAVTAQQLEVDLAAGRVACPDCCGRLARWGFARSREVRMRDGVRWVRPRRGVLSALWSYACAVSVMVGAAPPRRGGGDRRGVALGCWWRGASPDRPAAGPSAGNGPRVAARRQSQRAEPASVRDQVGGVARSGAWRRHCGRQRARRRGRGGHDRRPCVGTAVRSRADRPVGASGLADRRAAVRPAWRAAVVATSRPVRSPAGPSRPAAAGRAGPGSARRGLTDRHRYARVGRIARPSHGSALGQVSRTSAALHGERSPAKAKRSQCATHPARPRPGRLRCTLSSGPPPGGHDAAQWSATL